MANQDRFLPAGTVLNAQYVVNLVLGAGGFGITYECVDRYLQNRVAVKEFLPRNIAFRRPGDPVVIATDQTTYDLYIAKFLEEARILKGLHDVEGIVKVHNFFIENNTAYMVMDYYGNGDLIDYIDKSGGRLQEDEAVRIGLTLARALKKIHEKNLLHRDIKPPNILFDDARNPVLCDFGAARYSMAPDKTVIVTPHYAPGEQYHAKGPQGPWTDLYSLAATLYIAVTGEFVPDAETRKNSVPFQRAREVVPALSEKFDEALYLTLQDQVEKRPQSADEFVRLLQGRDDNEGLKTKPAGDTPMRWAVVTSVVLIAAIAAVVAFGGYPVPAIVGVLLYFGLMYFFSRKFNHMPGMEFWRLVIVGYNVKLLLRAFRASRPPIIEFPPTAPNLRTGSDDGPQAEFKPQASQVVFLSGEHAGEAFEIRSNGLVICRLPDEAARQFPGVPCVVFRSEEVSRVHVTITVDDAHRLVLKDHGSLNGTFVTEAGAPKWDRVKGQFVVDSDHCRQYKFMIGRTSEIFEIR